jgi:prepilin-type processing-associated H-X9-DG protein
MVQLGGNATVLAIIIAGVITGGLLLVAVAQANKAGSAARAAGDEGAARAANRSSNIYGCGCIALFALGILALGVITMPHHDRERAKRSRSLNNIKQLALAVEQYAQDYNGALPGWVRNPDGRYAHNVWDQQIDPSVKSKDSYNNGDTGIRSYSDPKHERVLTYGLNGLLITPPKTAPDGNADFSAVSRSQPPAPLRPHDLGNPSRTILFAELATRTPMPGEYGQAPSPLPTKANAAKQGSSQWQAALDGWIDISPRAFIEVVRPIENNYTEPYAGYKESGIARTLDGGGGSYAFADGHAKFMKISQTVGIGTVVNGKTVTAENCWEAWNTNNMWSLNKGLVAGHKRRMRKLER